MKSSIKLYHLFFFIFIVQSFSAQTNQQKKMEKLSFMIGNWKGVSTTFKNDTIATKVPAFQIIKYSLDKSIITIDLNSETLQLHTVIYFDTEKNSYTYNSYYKGGAGKYTGEFKDGKFIVSPNTKKRFVFNKAPNGGFQEYGETLKNGKWTRYFEDNFTK